MHRKFTGRPCQIQKVNQSQTRIYFRGSPSFLRVAWPSLFCFWMEASLFVQSFVDVSCPKKRKKVKKKTSSKSYNSTLGIYVIVFFLIASYLLLLTLFQVTYYYRWRIYKSWECYSATFWSCTIDRSCYARQKWLGWLHNFHYIVLM